MKYLKLKFLLMFFALAMAIPPAWAETVTLTLEDFPNLTGSYTSGSITKDGITYQYTNFIKSSPNIQVQASSGSLNNTTAYPGNITSVAITHYGTARPSTILGSSDGSEWIQVATGSGSITGDFSGKGYKYFKITRGSNVAYWTKIVITYETGGSSLTPVTLSFPENSYTATIGQTFTAPTLTVDPEEADSEVVYSSSNTNVASVNSLTGAVTLVGAGETTITAAINGSDTYLNAIASYTLTVEEAPEEGVIIDFKETFNDCDGTGGNDGGWSGSIASAKFDTDLADNSGWTIGENVYKAYKCIKLGKSGGTSYATTPSISVIPGIEYTLTFKAGAWNGAKTDLYITATGGSLSQSSVTMQNNAWTTYTITFTPTSDNATFKFQGVVNDGDARFFLDEVVLKHEEAIVVATPTFSLADGTYSGAQTVNISCETEDAIIYYKIGDGNWIEGSSLTVNQSSTVYAKAVLDGVESEIASATYTITYDPYITVTKTELSINDVVGEENKFDVSARNIRDWQNLSVTPNNGFSVSGTSTPSTWYNDNGNTGFYSNSEHSADGTVTVTYEGRELIATGNVNCGTNGAEPKNVAVSYRSDLYIVNNNGQGDDGWNFNEGIPMTYADDVYTGTITTTNPDTKVVFARLLGNGVGWNSRLVFGAQSDGDWEYGPYTEGNLNVNDDVAIWFPEAGEYTITINASNKTFSIVKTEPITYCPAVIEFKDNGTDESSDIADLAAFRAYLNAGSQFIQDASWGKVYKGETGIKFSSKSVNGNLLINLEPLTNGGSWKTSKVIVNAKRYGNDDAYISVNNQAGQLLTDEFDDYEFTLNGSEISTIEIDATKRLYLKSITIMHECGDEPIVEQVATPTFNPAEGEKDGVVDVRIECATGDATIYYTLDGSEPTSSSNVYGDPIHLNETTTVKAIAMKDGMDNSAVATAEYTLPTKVETIAAAQALNENTKFIFDAEAVVTFQNGSHLYIRQGEASGQIFGSNVGTFTNGDVLNKEWSAKYEIYQQYTPQFTSPKNVSLNKNNGAVAPLLLEKKIELSDVNKYAAISGVTITRIDGINYYFTDGESKAEYCLRRAYADLVPDALLEGKTYNVEGVVVIFFNETDETYTPQLNLTKATLVKQDPGLAFSEETVNTTYGAAFTAPTLSKPEDLTATISYASDNTNVATVDAEGKVTIVGVGNAKITASSTETTYYLAGEAFYNIVVAAATPTFEYSAATKEVVFGTENPELPTLNNPNELQVTYSSSKPEVATVDETGKVTIVGIGETIIKATGAATGNYSGAEAQYTLTVTAATPTFAYSAATKEVVFGSENPELPTLNNPNELQVTYSSSKPAVATVDETGKVSIVGIGQTTITATGAATGNYAGAEAQYTLTVTAATPTFAYSAATKEIVFGTENPELPTLNNPNELTVTYTSSVPTVATVNEQGVVTIVGAGTTTIKATGAATGNYSGAEAQYTLTVTQAAAGLSYPEGTAVTVTVGDDVTEPTLNNPNNLTVTYTSSNPEVATVDANGNVTIVGPGTTTITATYTAGEGSNYATGSASYNITVNDVVVALAAPTFAPAAGTYTEPKEVAIACATPGVTIEYKIGDGNWTLYEKPFEVKNSCTVTATAKMGTRTVYTPATSSATYTINAASAATIADDYYFLQSNAAEVSGKYANVAGRRTLNFVADADKQAGTVFRIQTGEGGAVKTLRSQAVDLQGYANRAMAYVPKAIELVLSTLNNASGVDDATGAGNILGENGVQLILKKFYENFDYNLYVEEGTEGTYRIYGRTPSMQHVVDFYHENTAQVEEKLPDLEGYINQVLDKIRSKIPAPYDANVVVPFSLKTVRDRIADKYGITLIDPTQDLMGFYRQVLNNKEYVWDFAYQTAMMYVDVIKETQTYKNLPDEYKLFVEKMEKVRPDTKYYIIERGNELDYISENNGEIIKNDPRTLWTLTKRENFTVNVPEANKLNDSYYTTLYTDFAYTLPEGVTAYAVTDIDDNDVAQLAELSSPIAAQTPVLLKANAAGTVNVTLTTAAGNTPETNLLEGPDYLVKTYGITSPTVEAIFNLAAAFVPADMLAEYEYLKLRTSGTVNNKYFWNVNDALEKLTDDCVVRSLAVKDGTLAFSEHWTTETNKAFLVSDTKPVIYLEKETLAAPTFSPVPGSYTVNNGESVTITITTEDDATIKYSTDGGKTWNTYEGPIAASDDMTIVAKAEKDGMIASDEVTAVYVIDNPAELPDVPVMKGYFQIMNNGNEKYAHVQGRKTLTFTNAPADKAGTVIWLETNNKGQVQSLRSQAADLQRYADRAMSYVPEIVELVADKLNADGEGNILGENGLDAIMAKFNKSFDHHLYVEEAQGGYRIYGKTPSMQPVVDFYREHTAQVEAKLPMLESFINSALNKLKQKLGGQSVFTPFSLHQIWENMGGNLPEPVVGNDAAIMDFYRAVLNNKNYVWDFAYQTAMIYVNNLTSHPRWEEVEGYLGEYAQYINMIEQVRPDFKYYIVADGDKPDFISEGNVDIKNNAARTIWTVEPRTKFTVNSASELFGCPLATNGVGGYFTTNYTDFAYTLPEGVTAYKVTGVNDEGEATLEALSGTIPAQTPVLLVAKEDKPYELTLTTDAGTAVTGNLLVGPDYLINEYDLKTEQVQSIFDLIKDKLGESFYNNYVAQYEYLADLNSGTVNNKYFWSVDNYLDDLQGDCVVRSLATDENGKLAFSEHWKTETNKAFLVSDTFDVITLPSFERGDVNHDGEINIKDVSDLIDRLLGNEANSCPYCSDVNCDDDVNIKDVSDLIDFLLNSGADTHVDTPTTDPEEGDGN